MEPQVLGDPFGKCGSVWHCLASTVWSPSQTLRETETRKGMRPGKFMWKVGL